MVAGQLSSHRRAQRPTDNDDPPMIDALFFDQILPGRRSVEMRALLSRLPLAFALAAIVE